MIRTIALSEKNTTFSILKRGTVFMKLCGLIVLLSMMIIFSNFNQGDAQVSQNRFYPSASLSESLTMKDMVSVTQSNKTFPVESLTPSTNSSLTESLTMNDTVSVTQEYNTTLFNSLTNGSVPAYNASTPAALSQQFYKQGNDLFDQGKYQDAISYYNMTLSIDPANINALYNKALALDKLNKTYDAISYYDKVLAITPNDTDTLNNKGVDLTNLGKYDEAILSYEKVLAITPNDTDALYNIGTTYDNVGKHDKAIFYYDKVLAIDPTNVYALNKMNLTYNNANKTAIGATQRSDQMLLIVVGIVIAILGSIIVIDLAAKRSPKLTQKVLETNIPIKEDEEITRTKIQEEDKSADIKTQDDDDYDWSGV